MYFGELWESNTGFWEILKRYAVPERVPRDLDKVLGVLEQINMSLFLLF